MKKTFFTLLLFSTAIFSAMSQNQIRTFTIKGIVVDSLSKETVPYATISVSKQDITAAPFKRLVADAGGNLTFTVNSADKLTLRIDAVGMKSSVVPVSNFTKGTIDLGKILMSSNDKVLSEVTVSAAKPLVKVDLDKIIYDMKSDPESKTNNVLEILRKVPLVTVDGDDNIKLKGKSNFKIYMNGKPTNMFASNPSQVLKTMPASTVKNIEVITEPGAKYEAEGVDGIINIVTEKTVAGYNGSVNAGVDMYGALNGGIYFSTKKGKWGFTSNIHTGQYENPRISMDYNRLNKTNMTQLNQKNNLTNNGNFLSGNVSLSYEIDSLNLITINGSGWGGNGKLIGKTYSSLTGQDNTLLQYYEQSRNSKNIFGGYETGVDYQHSFMKPDKLLTVSYKLSISPSGSDNRTNIDSAYSYPQNNQHIETESQSNEHTFQIDYTEPFNKKHVMEIGAKYIIRNNNSHNIYEQFTNGSTTPMPIPGMINDDFYYRQDVLGAYASYTFKQQKFSLKVGGRFEHTGSDISYKNQPEKNFKPASFNNVVPSVNFNYMLTQTSNLQFSYTQRLSRPSISYLNPFRDISMPTMVRIGNPNLKTEISNTFSLNYGFFNPKINLSAGVFHSFDNNSIQEYSYLNGDTTYTTYNNIGANRNTGITTYFRWQITPKINTYFNGNSSYIYLSDGNKYTNKGFNYGGNLGSSIILPNDISLNLFTGLYKMNLRLQGSGGHFFYYGLGINKSVLEKKLTFSMNTSMFLQKYLRFNMTTETETFLDETRVERFAPNLRFSISYRFGEMKEQIKKVTRTIENNDIKSGGSNDATSMPGNNGTSRP